MQDDIGQVALFTFNWILLVETLLSCINQSCYVLIRIVLLLTTKVATEKGSGIP